MRDNTFLEIRTKNEADTMVNQECRESNCSVEYVECRMLFLWLNEFFCRASDEKQKIKQGEFLFNNNE